MQQKLVRSNTFELLQYSCTDGLHVAESAGFGRREICEHGKRREVLHGTGIHITGSSCRVHAFLVVLGRVTLMMEASFSHITFAYQDMNCYAVATIEETLLLCNVCE
jgi:hypothetical protein